MDRGATKNIAILGSTGSIGTQCLASIEAHKDVWSVTALAAGGQWEAVVEQCRRFSPKLVSVARSQDASKVRSALGGNIEVVSGAEGLERVAIQEEADLVVGGLSGGVGLRAVMQAIETGHDVALANKEVLVLAGHLIMEATRKSGAKLLPVDSEISAIWQCLEGHDRSAVERVILTASGGPFRKTSLEDIGTVTPEQALDHPTWVMGRKVTIDSATLMNKGFEIHEIHWLFDIPLEAIEVVVHPQSIVHSMVEFSDGAIIAQLGAPDMTVPIQYGLSYPHRLPTQVERMDFAALGQLTFERPDLQRSPCLRLAQEAALVGGTMPAVLSGADEAAVNGFLDHRIPFSGISQAVEGAMSAHSVTECPDLELVIATEQWASEWVEGNLNRLTA